MVQVKKQDVLLEECLEIPTEVQEKIAFSSGEKLVSQNDVNDLSFVSIAHSRYVIPKRILDVMISLFALLLLAIPMLIVCAIVYLDDPGNVIFSQYRVGKGGHRFKLYKLRTMRQSTPKYMSTSEVDDPNRYITRAGRILRRLSIDELPQLINVLKGDMSIVGPRPLISDEHEIHELRMKFGVYKIRPGLTGMAQIHGRDMVLPAEKVRWDVRYLKEFSFWTDVKIILATIPKVFVGQGIVEGFKKQSANAEEESR